LLLRPARPGDADEVARLAEMMYRSLGMHLDEEVWERWRTSLRALLEWFGSEGVDNVELHASPDGEPLYRSEGFWEGSTALALRRRSWDPAPTP